MKSNSKTNFGRAPQGDMARVKQAADGSGKPDNSGSVKNQEQPGKPASGEMSKVKQVANITPDGSKR